MCHVGEGKPFGNKYTRSEGEISDMWHMKGSRTAPFGFVDDQYTDHTRYDAKASPNAGRKSDPGGPEYSGFPLENGKPKFMQRDGKPPTLAALTTSSRAKKCRSTTAVSSQVTRLLRT
jgi:hypothetical protein